jgi:hypothetical protein
VHREGRVLGLTHDEAGTLVDAEVDLSLAAELEVAGTALSDD